MALRPAHARATASLLHRLVPVASLTGRQKSDRASPTTSTSGQSGFEGSSGGDHPEHHQTEEDIRPLVDRVLRETHAAQSAAAAFWRGQTLLGLRDSVDVRWFRDQEVDGLRSVEQLLPKHRARPSLLTGTLKAAGCALGLVAAVAPRSVSLAVSGAVQDALLEHYTDQLRDIREAGASDTAADVRQAVISLRDASHAPEGAPAPPDLLAFQRMERLEDIGLSGAVGAVVKTAARMALSMTQKI